MIDKNKSGKSGARDTYEVSLKSACAVVNLRVNDARGGEKRSADYLYLTFYGTLCTLTPEKLMLSSILSDFGFYCDPWVTPNGKFKMLRDKVDDKV